MSETVQQLPGNTLSTLETPHAREVRQISVEMLPVLHAQHLENFADRFGEGWLDPQNKHLCLQFHFVTIFINSETERIWLSVPGVNIKIPLSPTRAASPVMGQRHPEIPWSGQSRFAVNEVVELPDWAVSFAKFKLMASVAGKSENIGIIHVGEISKGLKKQPANDEEEARISAEKIAEPECATIAVKQAHQEIASKESKTNVRAEPLNFVTSRATRQGTLRYINANGVRLVDRIKGMNRLLLLTVILPTLISVIYFGLIASDVYISESRFVVRSPERQTSTGLGSLLQGSGFSRSQDDTYTIHDFIFSRDALKQLDDQFAVGKAFSSSAVDIFSRFSGLGGDNSFEALYRYYLKRVTVDMETSSSISTLSVSAFTPTDAYQMNEKLLEMSEGLVNQLNERGRQDMIRFASAEVATAEQKAKMAALAVSNYRNQKGVFDPEKQSALQLQQVSKLQDELIANQIQLAQIRKLTRDNPQISSLQQHIDTLQTEINSETAKVVGGNRSLANKSSEYEGLILERGFAEKQLAAALTSLEQARNDAQRKLLYLERIVQPGKPDIAMEPRRIRNIFATLVLGLMAWGILTMLLAGVREHQD